MTHSSSDNPTPPTIAYATPQPDSLTPAPLTLLSVLMVVGPALAYMGFLLVAWRTPYIQALMTVPMWATAVGVATLCAILIGGEVLSIHYRSFRAAAALTAVGLLITLGFVLWLLVALFSDPAAASVLVLPLGYCVPATLGHYQWAQALRPTPPAEVPGAAAPGA